MFWKWKRQPYVTFLPEPADAIIGILRQVIQQRAAIPAFEVGLSSLESPSARLAVEYNPTALRAISQQYYAQSQGSIGIITMSRDIQEVQDICWSKTIANVRFESTELYCADVRD